MLLSAATHSVGSDHELPLTFWSSIMTKLVPIVTPDSAAYFCVQPGTNAPYLFPAMVGESEVLTGFIRTGVKVSLLGLSYSPTLLEAGEIDHTDSIEDDLRVASVALGTSRGEVLGILEIPNLELSQPAVTRTEGNQHKLHVRLACQDMKFEDQLVSFQLEGEISLDMGTIEIHAIRSPIAGSELAVIGYSLDANRINHNRRPRHVQV
jgi:hypothetical protein